MTDENDDDLDLEEIRSQATSMGAMMGLGFRQFDPEPSEEVKLAKRMMMAGNAIEDFVDYIEENDIDFANIDQREVLEMDHEERIVLHGFMATSGGFQRLGEALDDDDDDNPFKVSDGDDPIY